MKPGFALSLSSDGIVLLHRAAGGWRNVGRVTFDAPDLAAALADLRKKGQRLDNDGLCKLIIPNDQIRYLSVDTGDVSPEERQSAARAALEGATPYAVDELAFDCSVDGPVTHVAAVARETLSEAEAFAQEHGFVPASFVAIPGDMDFLGEPFFGQAPSLTAHSVEPDGIAVVDIGPVEVPAAPIPPAPEATGTPAPVSNSKTEEKATQTSDQDTPPPAPVKKGKPASESTLPPIDKNDEEALLGPIAGFSSRRGKARKDEIGSTAADKGTAKKEPSVKPAASPKVPGPVADKMAKVGSPKRVSEKPQAKQDTPEKPRLTAERSTQVEAPKKAPISQEAPSASKPIQVAGPAVKAEPEKTVSAPKPIPAAPPLPDVDAKSAPTSKLKKPDPLFQTPERKKPRLMGLVLTVGLLIFMAAVAALAVWNPGNILGTAPIEESQNPPELLETVPPAVEPQPPEEEDSSALPPPTVAEPTQEVPEEAPIAPQVSVLADQPDPGVTPLPETDFESASPDPGDTPLTSTDTAVLDALRDPASLSEDELAEITSPEGLNEALPIQPELNQAAQYAATGIWHQVPEIAPVPGVIGIDDIYVASIDRTDLSQDAVALPPSPGEEADLILDVITSPASPGGAFDLDARGLVKATPEGTLNPDGIMVYLGRPSVVPPETPNRPDPEAEAQTAREEQLARLQLARPRSRPDNLEEQAERSRLGGLSRAELAKIRPRLRPVSRKTEAEANQPVSNLAIVQSVPPRARPANFANLVDRAIRRHQEATPASASATAAIAPQTVSPSIPSSASVARQATIDNAINLRRINLIGVYGTAANRRALVRLASGRYRKVQIGDRIDGGKIIAIGDTQLKYEKGGRSVTLKLPGD